MMPVFDVDVRDEKQKLIDVLDLTARELTTLPRRSSAPADPKMFCSSVAPRLHYILYRPQLFIKTSSPRVFFFFSIGYLIELFLS